jgi:iron complex outermembrane receptor protein
MRFQFRALLAAFILLLIAINPAKAQYSIRAKVVESGTKVALANTIVQIKGTKIGANSNADGLVVFENLPAGTYEIEFRYIGFETQTVTFQVPYENPDIIHEIIMELDLHNLREFILTTTRSSRTIEDTPTRVEFIAGEELEEKGNMKPGDIRMLLNESTGIQTQQTSATSYNSSIRIQGLDGKYTQLLKDGYPLYSGFSGGLSLLQIIPLDLRQVEVIKGSSSTLYGGGAIAGLVNLISKVPGEKPELRFMANATSAAGLDLSGFYAARTEKVGTTLFASYNTGSPYDPADIGLTAIPEFNRYTVNPKLFYYPTDASTLMVGFNTTIESRTGGDIEFIKEGTSTNGGYFETNETTRFSTQIGYDYDLSSTTSIHAKNSISYYDRSVEIPDFMFQGSQVSSFSEISLNHRTGGSEWIGGFNLWTDSFNHENPPAEQSLDLNESTVGGFIQHTRDLGQNITVEAGLRGDYQSEYGFLVLPRASLLFRLSPDLTTRIGGGLGYKTPTVFTEDAEKVNFRNIRPLNTSQLEAERSGGLNLDINYRITLFDEVSASINTLLFYTKVENPLLLQSTTSNMLELTQSPGSIDTRGIEVNSQFSLYDFKLFIGYTHADVNRHENGNSFMMPLVSKHRLNNVLMYEIEEKLRIGLEAYYFSPQSLSDGNESESYWIMGLMTEYMWENFSLFLNFENFTDTRQSKFGPIYTGSLGNPTFVDIYAPVDGFVINGGIKLSL